MMFLCDDRARLARIVIYIYRSVQYACQTHYEGLIILSPRRFISLFFLIIS